MALIEQQFAEVHNIIELHRSRALQAINNETLFISWQVGAFISDKLKKSEWGSKVVTQLCEYLRTKDPSLKGYSRRNIYNMVNFYESYSSADFLNLLSLKEPKNRFIQIPEIVQYETAQLQTNEIVQNDSAQIESPIVQNHSAQLKKDIPKILLNINWSNHVEILTSCKSMQERLFYILYAIKEKLLLKELRPAIKTNTFEHILSNKKKYSIGMSKHYPDSSYQFKDVAYLDFLGLPEKHSEKKLQNGILENMKKFILELGGKDFLFIDQEYSLPVGGKPYKSDLLFFHRGLQCLIAVELKSKEFEPEFLGKLEFYLEALDRDVKRSNENPSIGILLCKSANREVVEYALNRSMSPTMIAEYKRQLIPKEVLQKSLDEFMRFLGESQF